MIISSGPIPMAYVLSNYKDSTPSCIGQHFFKFDPKSIAVHPSAWTKKTVGSNPNNCGHLGLTFGRGEHLFYVFSWYNSLSTVSLLDINGNSIWQYITPNGHPSEGNLIQYKAIDSATDMIIATSG